MCTHMMHFFAAYCTWIRANVALPKTCVQGKEAYLFGHGLTCERILNCIQVATGLGVRSCVSCNAVWQQSLENSSVRDRGWSLLEGSEDLLALYSRSCLRTSHHTHMPALALQFMEHSNYYTCLNLSPVSPLMHCSDM